MTQQLHNYPCSKKGHTVTPHWGHNRRSQICKHQLRQGHEHVSRVIILLEIPTADAMKIILECDIVQTDTDISEERSASILNEASSSQQVAQTKFYQIMI